MNIGVIIQARMGSTRFSGKIMKNIKGKTVLQHVIERVRQSKLIDDIIIATTIHERDDIIEHKTLSYGAKVYRGSEDDVLSRYYNAARDNSIDLVIRITSDCPLIDPLVIDEVIDIYLKNNYDIVSNAGSDPACRTFPRGLDVEVFSFEILENAFNKAKEPYQREHVTPYIYENSQKVFFHMNSTDYSKYRCTLDTIEDFELIKQIYDRLYKGTHNFYLKEIIELFNQEPNLYKINAHIEQKKIE